MRVFLRILQVIFKIGLICQVLSFFHFRSPRFPSHLYPWNVAEPVVEGDVYHSAEVFRMNYAEMEMKFKIYAYPDGDDDMYYHPPRSVWGKYASEGYFFKNIKDSSFLTDNPHHAHLFFIPFSCHKMYLQIEKRTVLQTSSYKNMTFTVQKYVEGLILKYPFWNRTLGSDHFSVACHESGLEVTRGVPMLEKNSIRAVCISSYSSEYIPHKDFAIPQIMQPFSGVTGGNSTYERTILGYWVGKCNSDIRKKLVRLWGDDRELDIQNQTVQYSRRMEKFYRSKFCICPDGLSGTSSRVMTAIHYGCVPVILGNHFDLPFSDILDWQQFSLILNERAVYRLKPLLKANEGANFRRLHVNLIKVQMHFHWNMRPAKFDAFHMVLYELWLRRNAIRY